MSKITTTLAKRPPDVDMLVAVLQESTQTSEATRQAATDLIAYSCSMQQQINRKLDTLINTPRVTTAALSMCFNSDPEILEGFTVEEVVDEKKKDKVWRIFYNGSSSSSEITKAYNSLRRKLLRRFGLAEIDFKMLSESIIQAYHWNEDEIIDVDNVLLDTAIVETAYNIDKKFTIPQLKQKLPNINKKTKDIEDLLINNGWEYVQYKNSRVKYFFKESVPQIAPTKVYLLEQEYD
jgi:hypothetical protein